jgi:hypothetical protein
VNHAKVAVTDIATAIASDNTDIVSFLVVFMFPFSF